MAAQLTATKVVVPRPGEVDGPGQQLLADARLPVEQDRRLQLRHRRQQLVHLLHGPGAAADDVRQREPLAVAAQRGAAGGPQLLELDGVAHHHEHLGGVERLDQVVGRPEAHGLHGRLDRAVGRHHDDGLVGMLALHAPHQLDAVHAGQALVGQHEVGVLGLEEVDGLLPAGRRHHLVARHLQGALQRAQEDLVVLDDEHAALHGSTPIPPARAGRPPPAG
jgi:hypothetical protein